METLDEVASKVLPETEKSVIASIGVIALNLLARGVGKKE